MATATVPKAPEKKQAAAPAAPAQHAATVRPAQAHPAPAAPAHHAAPAAIASRPAPTAHPAPAQHHAPVHPAPAATHVHAAPAHPAPAAATHVHAAPAATPAAHAAAPKKKKSPAAKKHESITVRGKRKESVARASIRKGKGIVRVNKMNLSAINNSYVRDMISEPLRLAGELSATVDVDIDAYGGGQMGQAQACRVAVAKALVIYSKDDALKQKMMQHDRSLLIEDSRRVEPKKYKGPKARARFQKSYR